MSEIADLKKTPLYEYYKENQVKLVDFGGWALPIQYTGIIEEHMAVRTDAGLFDVSHMGEIWVEGAEATSYLNRLMTNNIAAIKENQAQYNAMCNENGGTLDDLIVFKLTPERYLVTPNAANTDKVFDWMNQQLKEEEVTIKNDSAEMGLLALQGPKAADILSKLTSENLDSIKPYHFKAQATVADIENVLISRTGYTGEDGFELYAAFDKIEELWKKLLSAGGDEGLKPCGLGSRDTLRLEAGLSLYGHELSEEISPIEGGIGFAVKIKKTDAFIGQETLKKQRSEGIERCIRGFELVDKGIARENYLIYSEDGKEIGYVTSGTKSPTLNKSIGLAMVDYAYSQLGTPIYVGIRKKKVAANITATPFYKRG